MVAKREHHESSAGFFERSLIVVLLFLSTGALLPLLRFRSTYFTGVGVAEGDPVIQRVWLVVYGVVGLLLLLNIRRVAGIFANNKPLWALVALALISALWSDVPELTFRRSMALVGTTGLGIYIAVRYSMREIMHLLLVALGLCAIGSLFVVWWFPAYAHLDGLRGLFLHKNALGRTMDVALLVSLLTVVYGPKRTLALIFSLLSLVLLLLSDSFSSLVVLVGLVVSFVFFTVAKKNGGIFGMLLITLALFLPIVVAWLAANFGQILASSGRDTTLTGRTEVWKLSWEWIHERYWFGYGYNGFWRGLTGPSGEIAIRLNELLADAHNGILNLWLDLGLVGVLLISVSYVMNTLRSLLILTSRRGIESVFPIMFLVLFTVANVVESNILGQNSIFWVLYVAVSIHVAAASKQLDYGLPHERTTLADEALLVRHSLPHVWWSPQPGSPARSPTAHPRLGNYRSSS